MFIHLQAPELPLQVQTLLALQKVDCGLSVPSNLPVMRRVWFSTMSL